MGVGRIVTRTVGAATIRDFVIWRYEPVEADFWHERWRNNLIGFHLDEVNPYLKEYWPELALPKGSRVLVPLCGKSVDLVWLAEQGYEVIGVELSPTAVTAFFDEQGLHADKRLTDCFEIWQSGAITILCGDFFDLSPAAVGKIAAVYDRAALVAMPENMRPEYVRQLKSLVAGPLKGLLVTLYYEQSQMDGPPFAVSTDEVRKLLEGTSVTSDTCEVDMRQNLDILDQNARFKQSGLNLLEEHIYLLRSRN